MKMRTIHLGCAKGLLIIVIALVSIILMQGIDWLIEARERGASSSAMQEAMANLQLGMNRQEAEHFLVAAWDHRKCDYPELSRDLYFFGIKDANLAAVLVLRFAKHEGREVLTDIATVENYMLDSGNYRECVAVN